MVPEKIEKLIVKYLINQASARELEDLETWIKTAENEKKFSKYIKINYAIDYNLKTFNRNKTKDKINQLIKEDKRVYRLKLIRKYSAYAAIFVGFMIIAYVVKTNVIKETRETIPPSVVDINNTSIQPGSDKATLTLDDGSIVVLDKVNTFQSKNAKSDGQRIIYSPKTKATSEIAYNLLTIPRGGQFFVELSDGTKVWLNSESQLKYPVSFTKGKTRNVELIYGEAYFDVSPSTAHQGAKFKVLNESQIIEVVGTEFNIKAYRDESHIYTTLVEGKVIVNSEAHEDKLIPGQQFKLDLENNSVSISKVNVRAETSWRNGVFSFKGKPLKDIMKVISRWYDVDVIFEKESLEDITFRGVLGKNQNLEEILETIKSLSIIKNYEIHGKIIILK